MVEIHSTIERLLSILDTSGLASLAEIARARLDEADGPNPPDFPSIEGADRDPDGQLSRQRDIVGDVVHNVITRELDMRHRVRTIISKLEIGAVLELEDVGEGRLAIADSLSSQEHEAQLVRFRSAWTALIRNLGGRLGDSSAG